VIHLERCDVAPLSRDAMYMQSPKALKRSMIEFSDSVGAQLGVGYPCTVTAPLTTSLVGTQFLQLFLDQVCLCPGRRFLSRLLELSAARTATCCP
jgi:hypothetical protein